MNYRVFKNGDLINTITASEQFVRQYCEQFGYSYELIPEVIDPPVEQPPTPEERVAALEENKLLTAQMSAQSEQMDFYEDCIAEMASIVYA